MRAPARTVSQTKPFCYTERLFLVFFPRKIKKGVTRAGRAGAGRGAGGKTHEKDSEKLH